MKRTIAICLMLAMFLAPRFSAADEVTSCEPMILDQLAGGARAVQVYGDIAVVANGYGGLLVFDVSLPSEMVELSRLDFHGLVHQIAITGDTVYVLVLRVGFDEDSTAVLEVVDISDPMSPSHVDSFDWGSWIWAVEILGDRAYTTEQMGVRILDIQDPWHPVSIGVLPGLDGSGQIAVVGTALYHMSESSLSVFDISDPLSPIWTAGLFFDEGGGDVVIGAGAAYMGHQGEVTVLDIADPLHPIEVESVWAGHEVLWTNGELLCAVNAAGFRVFDLEDPLHPTWRSTVEDVGASGSVAALSDTLLVPRTQDGIHAFELADPDDPQLIGVTQTMWPMRDVVSHQGTTYATGSGKMAALDLTDSANIRIVGTPGGASGHISFSGDLAVVGTTGSMTVVDLHHPDAPERQQTFEIPTFMSDMVLDDDLVYIAGGWMGMTVVDVSDPGEVTMLVEPLELPGWISGVAKRDNLLYFAAWGTGLLVVDVQDPAAPEVMSEVAVSGAAARIVLDGDYAYLGGWNGGLSIVDISDPNAPVFVSTVNWPYGSPVADLMIRDGLVFAALYSPFGRVQIIDVRDVSTPVLVESISLPTACLGLHLDGDLLLIAAGDSGIVTVDVASCLIAACPPDLNHDGVVDWQDLLQVLGAWSDTCSCPEDLDEDGMVGALDLQLLIANWGPCSG